MPTLISKANAAHKTNKARKPVTNEVPGRCGIRIDTKAATTAMLHQGRYKQTAKLSKIINANETRNFVMFYLFKHLLIGSGKSFFVTS